VVGRVVGTIVQEVRNLIMRIGIEKEWLRERTVNSEKIGENKKQKESAQQKDKKKEQ